jgi:hypothetical protein
MKQVSTLFDALRNEKFAIVVKDGMSIRHYGVEGAGREWAQWANSVDTKSLESSQIPAGVIQGPFKNINEISLKSLINSLGYQESMSGDIFLSKSYSYKGFFPVNNGARVPAVMDTPIGHFTTTQYSSAVNYKALTMRTQIKEGSFLFEARANNYAFNFEKSMYNSMPSKAEIKSLRQRIDNNLGRSTERRLGIKLKNAIIQTGERKNIGVIYGLETKSLGESLEQKGIGRRIGGAARLARRAGKFNPKAWDGDGDGLVQEGTPFQRPAIPGVNDRSTGGRVDVRRVLREAGAGAGKRTRGQTAQRTVTSSPPDTNRSGLASRTQADIDKEVSKEITDMVREVLSKKSTSNELRSLVNGLGPDGATELTRNQEDRINEHIDAFDGGEYENMEDFMSDVANVLQNRPSGPKKPGQSGMRSRVSTARTQRQVDGLASRSSKAKKKSKLRGTPGRDRVDEKDGQLWESLTPEQKDVVEKNTKQAYQDLMEDIKKRNGDWWSSFLLQNSKQKKTAAIDADGKEWSKDSRIAGEALTSLTLAIEDASDDVRLEVSRLEGTLSSASPEDAPKIQKKIDKLKKDFEREQKALDDLRTFDQMQKNDDWSLLEHLHPETRQKSFGKKIPTAKKGDYEEVKQALPTGEPSTIFEEVGGAKRQKARLGDKADSKLADFARRITRPNPERAERRRLRKTGRGVAVEDIEEASDKASPLKRRIRRAKNQFLLNVKKRRDAEAIESKVNSTLNKNFHAFRKPDGSIVIDDKAVSILAGMSGKFKVSKRKGAKGEAVVTNEGAKKVLKGLWNGNAYNALPTWIREDEIPDLIEQGWIPIKRGFDREAYADIWLNSPKRHVPGQGMAVVGAGEYWSYQDGGWESYFGGKDGKQADGVIGMVKKDRIATSAQADSFREHHRILNNAVDAYITGPGSGGRWDKELNAQELAQEIEEMLSKMIPADSDVWNTEWGKVYQGVFSWMKTVDPKDTTKKEQAIETLKFLNRMADADATVHAGFLGYDGIDFGFGDGRIVMHNRGAMVAVNQPMSLADIKKVGKGERVKATDKKTKVKKSSRKGGGSSGSLDNKSWKQVGPQGGSQPGAEFEDPNGKKFYVKKQKSQLHAENEVLMSKLYERLGVRAAKNSGGTAHISGQSSGPGVFSEWLDGSRSVNHSAEVRNPKWKKSVQDTFVASAWLANWDGTGNGDNIKMGANGEAYIIDTGGAGLFRARGDSKGSAFGPIVGEMESLRAPGINSLGAMYFSDIPAQEIARQVASIGALSDADIRKMVNDVVTDSAEAKNLADTLIARRDYLVQTWGTGVKK